MFSWRCFPFVESAPRAYRLKASNAAPLSSTSAGTFPPTAAQRAEGAKPGSPMNSQEAQRQMHAQPSVAEQPKGEGQTADKGC
jgi:hypothetical protein